MSSLAQQVLWMSVVVAAATAGCSEGDSGTQGQGTQGQESIGSSGGVVADGTGSDAVSGGIPSTGSDLGTGGNFTTGSDTGTTGNLGTGGNFTTGSDTGTTGSLGTGGSFTTGTTGNLGTGSFTTGSDTGTTGNLGTGGSFTTGSDTGTTGNTSTNGSGGGEATAGCGNAGAAKGAQNLGMDVNGTARTYWLWAPEGYDPNSPIPLIFAWHGSGGDGDEVRRTYFYLEPAVGDGAIIIYPDGLPVDGGSTGWDLEAEGIDVQFFDALLASVSQDYCIDLGRVFSTGYSFGGMFSHALACSRGSQLRGIAPTAGAFFGGSTCSTPVPAWIAHAPNDDLVEYSWAEDARDVWLSTNGCGTSTMPTSPEPCVAYDCPADAPVHWCVHNEGHEWPSFAADGIWAFFSSL